MQKARRGNRVQALRDLLASGFITQYLNAELSRLAHRDPSLGRAMNYLQNLTLLQTPEFTLKIRFREPANEATEIISTARATVLAPIFGKARLQRYRVPETLARGTFDARSQLAQTETTTLTPGDVVSLPPVVEAFVATPLEGEVAFIVLEDAREYPAPWRFNPHTLRCAGAMSTDIAVSRLRETLLLTRALRIKNIAGFVRALYDHPSHLIRWSALSTLLHISKRDGMRLLARATRDAHPQLRRVAKQMLEQRQAGRWH